MKDFIFTYKKPMAILLVLIFMLPIFNLLRFKWFDKSEASVNITDADRTTAQEIANLSGKSTDELLGLRRNGKSWNEVISLVKKDPAGGKITPATASQAPTTEPDLIKLTQLGFSKDDIRQASLFYDRVLFQIGEISSQAGSESLKSTASAMLLDLKQADQVAEFDKTVAEIAQKIKKEAAISWMLKLKKEMNGMEKAFDEYLFSLQTGLDLQQFLDNKKEYIKQKNEKMTALNSETIITAEKIEQRMLQKLEKKQEKTQASTDFSHEVKSPGLAKKPEDATRPENITNFEAPKAPTADNIKPANPADDVMKEISKINERNQPGVRESKINPSIDRR